MNGSPAIEADRSNRALARSLRWLAAATLFALTLAHPPYSSDPTAQLVRISSSPSWLLVHFGMLAAIAAFDVALLTWPGARGGPVWRVRQLGVLIHLVAYSAFIGVDGVAGEILARFGSAAAPDLRPGVAAAVGALFSAGPVVVLALIAGAGWLMAVGGLLVQLAAQPRYLPAVGLLLAAIVTLTVSHSPPPGPIGAAFALGAAAALDLANRNLSVQPRV